MSINQMVFDGSTRGGWLGRTCYTFGREEKCLQSFGRKTWGTTPSKPI